MTKLQSILIAVLGVAGLVTGYVLSETFYNENYMKLLMGFSMPVLAMYMMPSADSGVFSRMFSCFFMVFIALFATVRAGDASLFVTGDLTGAMIVALATALAISVVYGLGKVKITLHGKLPVIGSFTLRSW